MAQPKEGLPLDWTKNLSVGSKESFESTVRNSVAVLSRLSQIIDDKINEVHDKESRDVDYNNPSWAYLQAHRNGKLEGLKRIRELLSFLDQGK